MADLLDRLGALATGDSRLARPRRRSRFEITAHGEPDGLVVEHHEREAPRLRSSSPRTDGPRVPSAHRDEVPPDAPRPGTAARAERRATVEPRVTPAAPATAGQASFTPPTTRDAGDRRVDDDEPSAPVGAPATVRMEHHDHRHEHHEHVHTTVHHEGHQLSPVTQLFQWIEERHVVDTTDREGAATTPAAREPERAVVDEREAVVSVTPSPRRADAQQEHTTTVSIGRVEVRTVRSAPLARDAGVAPAPLEFAGPTLEEFLGGRP